MHSAKVSRHFCHRVGFVASKTPTSASIDENWKAFFDTIALFRDVSIEVAEGLGFDYARELDTRVLAYLEWVQADATNRSSRQNTREAVMTDRLHTGEHDSSIVIAILAVLPATLPRVSDHAMRDDEPPRQVYRAATQPPTTFSTTLAPTDLGDWMTVDLGSGIIMSRLFDREPAPSI